MNVVFFGNPELAVPFLDTLQRTTTVKGVVCSPDKPVGRGHEVTSPPVKRRALDLGLSVKQPATLKDGPFERDWAEWGDLDLGVAVAYGKLIPPKVFNRPRWGMLNVHFSLLPHLRGAAPVQWSLVRGDTETGVTLFRLEATLDSGPIFLHRVAAIGADEDAPALRRRLVALGVELLDEAVRRFARGPWEPTPQQGPVTYAPLLKKAHGMVHWARQTAWQVHNLARGLVEWPGARTGFKGKTFRIIDAQVSEDHVTGQAGTVVGLVRGKGFCVQCREGTLLIRRVRPDGKQVMDAWGFWNGARGAVGDTMDVDGGERT